jgi:hypothetical protein
VRSTGSRSRATAASGKKVLAFARFSGALQDI